MQPTSSSSRSKNVSRNIVFGLINRFFALLMPFSGLTMTAIYSNYFAIYSAVISISGILGSAITASVGNSIALESTQKTYNNIRRFNFLYMLLAGWLTTCMLCLYQPFVSAFVKKSPPIGDFSDCQQDLYWAQI